MTETMILIALLSMAAGALLMGIVLEIAEAIWRRHRSAAQGDYPGIDEEGMK